MDRSRKRPEAGEEFPADKRACTSSVPSDESSSDEGEGEGGGLERSKFQGVLSGLEDPGAQLAALTQLCELLSFSTDETLPRLLSDAALPPLVRLAGNRASPDVMLLAVRALTYLCDVMPRSADAMVRHSVVPAVCAPLLGIDYLDVAEQCLQCLEKISQRQPGPCLQAGAIMAALSYIDFFSTSVQRVALSIVANICKKLPLDSSSLVMEAVPTLCNLLQYEDRKLVETVATSLIRITECFSGSPVLLDELCKNGVINSSARLIATDGRMFLGQATYCGLIGVFTKLSRSSPLAIKTLFELNISKSLKEVLVDSSLSHGTPYSHFEDRQANQVHEVLKLLNHLIPGMARDDEDIQLVLSKEKIIRDQPEFLHQFSLDILPVSIQAVNSGANLYVSYGCVSIINNIIYFSTPDMLLNLMKDTNISSFLASLLARKDHHVLIVTLKIVESLMQKLPGVFLSSFIKEGVIYAVDTLLTPKNCSLSTAEQSGPTQLSDDQMAARNVSRCLCYTFDSSCFSSSESKACRLGTDTVLTLAKHLKATYFNESLNSDMGVTETLEKLKVYCAVLNDIVDKSATNDGSAQNEEYLSHVLDQVMGEVRGGDTMSTFEFIESGVAKSLAHYLCNGRYLQKSLQKCNIPNNYLVVLKRFQTFACIFLSQEGQSWEEMLLTSLVRKLQNALSSLENFPVTSSHISIPRSINADIWVRRLTMHPYLKVRFLKEDGETNLIEYDDVLTLEVSSSFDVIEGILWPKVRKNNNKNQAVSNILKTIDATSGGRCAEDGDSQHLDDIVMQEPSFSSSLESLIIEDGEHLPVHTSKEPSQLMAETDPSLSSTYKGREEGRISPTSSSTGDGQPKLTFSIEGILLDRSTTLYQAILQNQINAESDTTAVSRFWNSVHEVTYKRAEEQNITDSQMPNAASQPSIFSEKIGFAWQKLSFFSSMLHAELPCKLDKSNSSYDTLFMLKLLEGLNQFSLHLLSCERSNTFAEKRTKSFDDLKVAVASVPQSEFMNSKLTDKLEQQLRDPSTVITGSLPSWCSQLMATCPFLFSFEARRLYFHLTAFGCSRIQQNQVQHPNSTDVQYAHDRRFHSESFSRKKFKVDRTNILVSATKMMKSHVRSKALIEVEYEEEVGSGLGPTLEFYTLVSHELQKVGLSLWREDQSSFIQSETSKKSDDYVFVVTPFGLFPRPWAKSESNGIKFTSVIKNFVLFGQLVAKAIKDGRILDIPLSKAFYKVMLDQELGIYDIQSFDPGLGRTLLEFQALINRKRYLESNSREDIIDESDLYYRDMKTEDLCLDFTLPGYSDYVLTSGCNSKMVNITNLEEYVSLVVDATIKGGISRQVEAFKSGFNEVFPLKALQIFTEGELERLVCGERDTWDGSDLLDHLKFDHGYTASSPPVISLLEIVQEFRCDQRRSFLQFVTGAPRLPLGGLAALNPKLTVVRKLCSSDTDKDLPSVMTCANYLKLPPYSSKEMMRERLIYAITEGQGAFHLS